MVVIEANIGPGRARTAIRTASTRPACLDLSVELKWFDDDHADLAFGGGRNNSRLGSCLLDE
jgi:hypothetical protein